MQMTLGRSVQTLRVFEYYWMVPNRFPLLREQPTDAGHFHVQFPSLPWGTARRYYIGSLVRAPACEREEFWALDHQHSDLQLRRLP
jgi:hypothetical protein